MHVRFHSTDPVSWKSYPNKSGVTFSVEEWLDLKTQLTQIEEVINITLDLMSAMETFASSLEVIPSNPGQTVLKKAKTLNQIMLQIIVLHSIRMIMQCMVTKQN